MDKDVRIGLILSAYDRASEVLEKVFGVSKKGMAQMKTAAVDIGKGMALWKMGSEGFKLLDGPIDAFGKMEAAGNDLKGAMMGPGGLLDEGTYKKITDLSMTLSDKYRGSAADYLDMIKTLKQSRINEGDILGGIGEATAQLSDLFDMAPAKIAEFSAHMRNDMGVAVGDMGQVMDLVARVQGSSGKSGSEAVTEMNDFFSKASLGAGLLGVKGLEASKQMGALGALFMSKGLSGSTVGTNFRRIFDGLRDPERMGKVNEAAAQFGKHLNLFGKSGKFLGMDNFVQQLGKLSDLSGQKVSQIFKAFGGKQGLSTDFIETLTTSGGLAGYQEFLDKMSSQADLSDKLAVKMKGLNYQKDVFNTSTENMKASLAEGFAPTLTFIYEIMNGIVVKITDFAKSYPHLFKMAAAFVAIASGIAMLMGAIRIVTALTTVLEAFGVVVNLSLGGIPIIVGAIVLALAALYAYWDKIAGFFNDTTIKWGNVFKNVAKLIWNSILVLILLPLNLVAKAIGGLGRFLHIDALAKAGDWADKMTNAGWQKFGMSYDDMTGVKPGSSAAARVGLHAPAKDATAGLAPAQDRSTVQNNVTVNLSGGATAADGKVVSDSIQTTFDKLMRDHEQRKARRAF